MRLEMGWWGRDHRRRERGEKREREIYIYIIYNYISLLLSLFYMFIRVYIYICIEKMCGYIYEFRSREIDREIDRYIYICEADGSFRTRYIRNEVPAMDRLFYR